MPTASQVEKVATAVAVVGFAVAAVASVKLAKGLLSSFL